MNEAGAHADKTPTSCGEGGEILGAHLLEEEVDRELKSDVGDEED